jgi:dihydrofolate reductase
MRKIIVIEMITLDGVIQGPGGKNEDPSGGFSDYGGWCMHYGDTVGRDVLMEEFAPHDYLLGRRSFEIWEPYWPHHGDFWSTINTGTKYVLSNTRDQSDWSSTIFLKDVDAIRELKKTDGLDLQVWGSSELVHLLLKHDLVDEMSLKIFPITLGHGKKLFEDNHNPTQFKLVSSRIGTTGVIFARYAREGAFPKSN